MLTKDAFLETMSKLFEPFTNGRILSFPGNLPVSLQRNFLIPLAFGYTVTFKADGVRGFLSIQNGYLYFTDRSLFTKCIGQLNEMFNNESLYVFDVEWCEQDNYILLFNTLIFDGKSVIRSCISQRVELAKKYINEHGDHDNSLTCQELQQYEFPSHFHSDYSLICSNGLKLFVKPLYLYSYLQDIWYLQHYLPYPIDGFIFNRLWCSYEPYRNDEESVIKWKPNHDITLDFVVLEKEHKIEWITKDERYQEFILSEGNVYLSLSTIDTHCPQIFSCATFTDDQIDMYQNQIVECSWHNIHKNWIPIRLRADKIAPNTLITIKQTLENIIDPIQISDFLT